MNKKILLAILAVVVLSCNNQTPEEQVTQIDGYWEIDRVEISEDSVRKYPVNESVDYFEIDGQSGFRKKMVPQFDGTYRTTEDMDEISVKIEDDSVRLYYKTPFASWKETLLEIDDENMSLAGRDGMIYHYKKFTPILEREDEKE